MPDVLRPWTDALGSDGSVVDAGRAVVARYEEPHRRYHDRRHLSELLSALQVLVPTGRPPAAVVLAAYWHDAVYEPWATDNEERSAVAAQEALRGLDLPDALGAEVGRLVRVTAAHDPRPDDEAGALLSDADLWVLAAPPTRYRAYAADVRQEYAHVPDDAFRQGRSAVLRSLLDGPSVYRTAQARALWEQAAHRNVEDELSRLAAGDDGAGPLR